MRTAHLPNDSPQLTVVIPTLCSEARGPGLGRAVASAFAASKQDVEVVAVANGSQVSLSVLKEVEQMGARVLRQAAGSLPLALAFGRSAVKTPFFAFLDDDDELLPGALDRRLAVMVTDPSVSVVVSNGYKEVSGKLLPMHPDMKGIGANPLLRLLERNWLASCAGLYRTSTIGDHFFQQSHGYAEWTWLAFKLCAAGMHVSSIESMDYVVHDTPLSLSKSQAYDESYVLLFERMLEKNLPPEIRRRVIRKKCDAYHHLSSRALDRREIKAAIIMHCKSLYPPFGLRYIPFTRHLIQAAIAKW